MMMKPHILNRLLPVAVRTFLRQCAVEAIPSMRHLDMPKRLRHLRTLGITPAIIYDVGAAQGHWARLAASIWPSAHIIGFEPNQKNIPSLAEAQRTLPHFEYFSCLLGARPQLVHYQEKGNQTSLYDLTESNAAQVSAQMLALDDLVAQQRIPPPNFIKLDVQGYELEVLRGATTLLKNCEAILIEVNFYRVHPQMPTVDEVIQFMKAEGFLWFDVMGILRRPSDDVLGYMDLLFVSSEHRLRQFSGHDWWGYQREHDGNLRDPRT